MKTRGSLRPAGFTLVEMLVVIVIIGILAGLLLAAIGPVRERALVGQMAMDLNGISQAMEAYKIEHKDYPPDCTDPSLVKRHILMAWPKIDNSELSQALLQLLNADPAEALVFWLGGFSSNPKFPFTGPGGPFLLDSSTNTWYANPERTTGVMEFDKGRLTWQNRVVVSAGPPVISGQLSSDGDGDIFAVYLPPKRKVPYVYFHSTTYGGVTKPPASVTNGYYPVTAPSPVGYARPYLAGERPNPSSPYGYEWVNDTTYQIICAGLDDNYGGDSFLTNPLQYPYYPQGTNYLSPSVGDDDNITNFSEGSTLGSKKP